MKPWAFALLAASCAAPAGREAPPPPGLGIVTLIWASQDGKPLAGHSFIMWKDREERLELLGPAPSEGEIGHGLEIGLTGDFNRAGEFWGEIWVAEFDQTSGGGRSHYLGFPRRQRLDPTTARMWNFEVPGRDGPYRMRVEMDYDNWLITEMSRKGF